MVNCDVHRTPLLLSNLLTTLLSSIRTLFPPSAFLGARPGLLFDVWDAATSASIGHAVFLSIFQKSEITGFLLLYYSYMLMSRDLFPKIVYAPLSCRDNSSPFFHSWRYINNQ